VPSDFRLSPQLAARLLGVSIAFWGLIVLVATMVVVLFRAPVGLLSVAVLACLVGIFVTGFLLTRRAYVVRLTDDGYRVRFVRGAGVKQGRWLDVQDAVTTTVAGSPCVSLRLKDGRSTTIPVEVLAGDREQFVRTLQQHLDRGHGVRKLS
jgi:hypothetical protein